VESLYHRLVARAERTMGRHSFVTLFAAAWAVAELSGRALASLFWRFPAAGAWFFDHTVLTVPLLVAGEMGITLYLMVRPIPTWIDNAYRHESRADNLDSLRRVAAGPER
jgi:hypothetical protein